MEEKSIREILETIIKGLVDNPDVVQIEEIAGSNILVYEIKVEQSDVGKIIGKSGRNASAIRTIIYSIAKKQGKGIIVRFNDGDRERK